MKKRLAELEAQASAAVEVISNCTSFSVGPTSERMISPCFNLLCNNKVSKSMKALEAELADLKKRLQEAEVELRKRHKEAEEAKVGLCLCSCVAASVCCRLDVMVSVHVQ